MATLNDKSTLHAQYDKAKRTYFTTVRVGGNDRVLYRKVYLRMNHGPTARRRVDCLNAVGASDVAD